MKSRMLGSLIFVAAVLGALLLASATASAQYRVVVGYGGYARPVLVPAPVYAPPVCAGPLVYYAPPAYAVPQYVVVPQPVCVARTFHHHHHHGFAWFRR